MIRNRDFAMLYAGRTVFTRKNEGMKLVSMGDGLENVSSKI